LIAIDALRADRLGCYGYEKETTPFLDFLASRGVLFENHFTPVVPTQPAFTTLYSGVHPLTHHVHAHEGTAQPNSRVTWLPLLLRYHDYCTCSVDNLADHKPWFWRGFEYYINPRRRGEYPSCREFNARAIQWLDHCRREPFFLNLHYWDTHTPYLPPAKNVSLFYEGDPTTTNVGSLEPFYARPQVERWPNFWFKSMLEAWPGPKAGARIEDVNFVIAQYDAEVRTADDGVRDIYEHLEKLGILDDTLIIVLGDHGEELGEHGIFFDHHGLYDSNIHVPLILHWPKGLPGGRRVNAMSQHQDLVATILDAMGKRVPDDVVEGKSLLPLARGQTDVSHWNHTLITSENTWQAKWAMRTPEYKLIVSRQPDFHDMPPVELYDLLEDPGERSNIVNDNPGLTRTLLERFDAKLMEMLTARGLKHDPVAATGITLGKRMFERMNRAYPPRPGPNWKPHPLPKALRPAPAARPAMAPRK
jgi:arylsulfatase A-like enzyme